MTSNAPPTYRSIFFSLLLFFFFFFFPLPFLSREYRSLSTSTRLRNLGYHGGHCADSRIGIKFQYTITLDPDFFLPDLSDSFNFLTRCSYFKVISRLNFPPFCFNVSSLIRSLLPFYFFHSLSFFQRSTRKQRKFGTLASKLNLNPVINRKQQQFLGILI